MNIPDFARGVSFGILVGTITTGFVLRKPVRKIIMLDKNTTARRLALFEHLIKTMGPYVPNEILEQNLEYMKFDSIIAHEEGAT